METQKNIDLIRRSLNLLNKVIVDLHVVVEMEEERDNLCDIRHQLESKLARLATSTVTGSSDAKDKTETKD